MESWVWGEGACFTVNERNKQPHFQGYSNPTSPCLSLALQRRVEENPAWGRVWEGNNIWPLIS